MTEARWQQAAYVRRDDPLCSVGHRFWVAAKPPRAKGHCFRHGRACAGYRTSYAFAGVIVRGRYGVVHAEDVELLPFFATTSELRANGHLRPEGMTRNVQ